MHMWHHVTNHLIISNDKDSNSENRIKLRVRDSMEMDRPVYRGEIHATPVNNRDDAHPELTNESLRMLEPGYRDRMAVEDALGCVGDWSLGAKVTRWNALKKKVKHIQDQIRE
jgi:hypothetical protein